MSCGTVILLATVFVTVSTRTLTVGDLSSLEIRSKRHAFPSEKVAIVTDPQRSSSDDNRQGEGSDAESMDTSESAHFGGNYFLNPYSLFYFQRPGYPPPGQHVFGYQHDNFPSWGDQEHYHQHGHHHHHHHHHNNNPNYPHTHGPGCGHPEYSGYPDSHYNHNPHYHHHHHHHHKTDSSSEEETTISSTTTTSTEATSPTYDIDVRFGS